MGVYVSVYVLCLLDYALTAFGIVGGFVVEANPLLNVMNAYPLEVGVLMAIIVGKALKWVYRQHVKWAIYPLCGIAIVKIGIIVLHVIWISKII